MKKRFTWKQAISVFLGATLVATQAMNAMPTRLVVNTKAASSTTSTDNNQYRERFKELYSIIMDEDTGYFDENGIPYHSIEKLMVEAPDYGHESTSEAASYLVWLQAVNGRITGDYSGIDKSWDVINKYFIPTTDQQPSGGYNPSSPATYADEYEVPSKYPSQLQQGVQVGSDPLYNELKNSYGTDTVYGMHWLVDVDNFFGFGQKGNLSQSSDPVYINTFQRGKMEGCWNTIPQPSWESFSSGGQSGFLPYFTGDNSYSQQWRYTIASDADARVVQAMYRAAQWAKNDGDSSTNVSQTSIDNTKKLGDYLRYSMYDKYFMKVGAEGKTAGNGKDSCQYLLSWYYAWGGDVNGYWSWKIGSSHSHFGYQNPFAAWVLSDNSTGFVPKSATAQDDWDKSYDTQLDFYQWLQSAEGGIAGGATNSWNGRYEKYPEGTSTFNGMAYQEHPVYSNPGSNQWFGMQCWSMQRVAEVYYETGNVKAKNLMDKWVKWVESQLHMDSDDAYLPGTLAWEGQPDTWTGEYTGNPNLHVTVTDWGHDVGISASLANTLIYYAARQLQDGIDGYLDHVEIAQQLLDKIWAYKDSKGLGDLQTWTSDKIDLFYSEYYESNDGSVVKGVYVPNNYANGKMPYGDAIKPGSSFYDLRKGAFAAEVAREKANGTDTEDGSLTYCMEKLENKEEFDITYHRFWANAEAAIAYGIMDEFIDEFYPSDNDDSNSGSNNNGSDNDNSNSGSDNSGSNNNNSNNGSDNSGSSNNNSNSGSDNSGSSNNNSNNGSDNSGSSNNNSNSGSSNSGSDIAVNSITLKPTSVTLNVGQSSTLKATISPSNATDNTIQWSSSNPNGLSVTSNGKIIALQKGTYVVTAIAGTEFATCTVTVTDTNSGSSDDSSSDNNNSNSGSSSDNNNSNSGSSSDNNNSNSGNSSDNNNNGNSGSSSDNNNSNSGSSSDNNNSNSGSSSDNNNSNSGNSSDNNNNGNSGSSSGNNNSNSGSSSDNNNNGNSGSSSGNNNSNSGSSSDNNNGNSGSSSDNNNNGNSNSSSDNNNNSNNTTGTPSGTTNNNQTNNSTTNTNGTTNNSNSTGLSSVPNYQVGTATDEPSVLIVAPDVYITNTTITTGTIINGSALKYQVTKCDTTGKEAMVVGLSVASVANVNVPNMIVINNEVYKVTSVKAKAFNNNKKIKKVTLGKNIKTIGSKAFFKCNKVKTVTIKSTKLKTKTVKAKAFAKTKANITVKVPKSKKAAYKKLLIKRGISKKAKFK